MERLREITLLETELNLLRRQKEVIDQEYERKKVHLLELTKVATTGTQHTELIRQMVELSSQWRQESFKINDKIYVRTQALNSKRQN
jgi:hypothetical protein